ncbi:MAG: purple acid phosphatase family protein, partial [Mycobacteriales bacterium]
MSTTHDAAGPDDPATRHAVDRRSALRAFGVAGAAAAASPILFSGAASAAADATTSLLADGRAGGAPPVQGLHLTFGADPTRQMVVSWLTGGAVRRPRVVYGSAAGGFGSRADATTRTYVDGASGRTVHVHHAVMGGLRADTTYIYAVQHDGAHPDAGTFRTAPRGRTPFVFTSFGDQSVPTVTWSADGNGGFAPALNANATPATADVVTGIERVNPLFHLLNGDLCYANLDPDRILTWNGFFANNTRSARFRPWMPCAGNHEIESGNGPIGLSAYQTYFQLPSTETDAELRGLWYSFTVGSVHVVSLQDDDVALQNGGDIYTRGYSGGRQRAWLRRDLAKARESRDIDWIVVCMHQVMISSSDANGSDLGIRQALGPLFDEFGVDLVVCGHEHDYERSLALRGVERGSETLTPKPVSDDLESIDTSAGTVHMFLVGGGVSGTTNEDFFASGTAKVITGVGPADPTTGKHPSVYTMEKTPWLGFRDKSHPYGFAAFGVDPGNHAGGQT